MLSLRRCDKFFHVVTSREHSLNNYGIVPRLLTGTQLDGALSTVPNVSDHLLDRTSSATVDPTHDQVIHSVDRFPRLRVMPVFCNLQTNVASRQRGPDKDIRFGSVTALPSVANVRLAPSKRARMN